MHPRRGYLLIEMMVVIGLLAMVGGMAIGIARWSLTYMHSTETAGSRTAALDQAIGQLRGDVWRAGSMRRTDRQTLQVDVDGTSVIWRLDTNGSISRTDNGPTRRWEAGVSGASFAIDGHSAHMIVPDTDESRGGTISMMSQLMLLGATHP
jgi:type II secretory pathway component PulJ